MYKDHRLPGATGQLGSVPVTQTAVVRPAVVVIGVVIVALGSRALGQDADAIGVPIDVVISVDEGAVAAHQTVQLEFVIEAEADLERIRLRASATGNVEIVETFDRTLPTLAKGERLTFGLTVRYGEPGESSVHVDVEAVITKVAFPFGDRATLNASSCPAFLFAVVPQMLDMSCQVCIKQRSLWGHVTAS